jgi:hypothetical protein
MPQSMGSARRVAACSRPCSARVYTENSGSGVLMVQSTKDQVRYNVSRVLNWA